jgi:hypothetical protein
VDLMSTPQEVWDLGKEVIGMLKAQPPPRVDGVAVPLRDRTGAA